MNKQYIFPHYKAKEKEISQIQGINRLFAYPKEPHFQNNSNITILDSGAFGLSLANRKMNIHYMRDLSKHYEKFYTKNKVLCIAPDVFKNPLQSMKNIKLWRDNNLFKYITPVLQNSKEYELNHSELVLQIDYYKSLGYNTLCFSIYKADAKIYKQQNIESIFLYAKQNNFKHIHLLGAGWSRQDILLWQSIKSWDTQDSIAYYNTKDIKEFGSLDAIENIRTITELFK